VKLLQAELLSEAVERLVACFEPEAIYLYGSHAYGVPHADSDIDLYVVVAESSQPPHQRAAAAYLALYDLGVPVEVTVATDAEFSRRGAWLNSVEREIRQKGQLLYAAA